MLHLFIYGPLWSVAEISHTRPTLLDSQRQSFLPFSLGPSLLKTRLFKREPGTLKQKISNKRAKLSVTLIISEVRNQTTL